MSQQHYAGVIWTHHALERLGQRGLTQKLAASAFIHPDNTVPAKNGGTEFQKRVGPSMVTVIAKQNEKREWIILSCWIDPPLPGSIDIQKKKDYHTYKKASFIGKIFITLKNQLFGRKY